MEALTSTSVQLHYNATVAASKERRDTRMDLRDGRGDLCATVGVLFLDTDLILAFPHVANKILWSSRD